ncbi:MAG TPA: hypothetical protein VIZ65_14920 [Cellvibrionaceae bacterium]
MKYIGPKERVDAARSLETSTEDLAMLSTSDDIFVRAAVAQNPRAPIQVLNSFAERLLETEKDWEIAANLAENPKLQTETLLKLMKSVLKCSINISPRDYYSNRTIIAASRSDAANYEIMSMLSNPKYIPNFLRYKLLQIDSRQEFVKLLLKDPSEKIRKRASHVLK